MLFLAVFDDFDLQPAGSERGLKLAIIRRRAAVTGYCTVVARRGISFDDPTPAMDKRDILGYAECIGNGR